MTTREELIAPTGDEREALVTEVYGIINSHYWMAGKPGICVCGHDVDADPAGTMAEHRAQAVVDAGIRRSDVPEPQGEHFHIWSELPCKPGECRMEPQGEPSDAQVRAAWDSLGASVTVHLNFEDLRAALRAAGGAR